MMIDRPGMSESLQCRLEHKYGFLGIVVFILWWILSFVCIVIAITGFVWWCIQHVWLTVIPFIIVGLVVWSVREKKNE